MKKRLRKKKYLKEYKTHQVYAEIIFSNLITQEQWEAIVDPFYDAIINYIDANKITFGGGMNKDEATFIFSSISRKPNVNITDEQIKNLERIFLSFNEVDYVRFTDVTNYTDEELDKLFETRERKNND